MNDKYIKRKERWAKKMSGKQQSKRTNFARLPAGQHEVNNFPVLDLGVHPKVPIDNWSLKIHGEVDNPITLNWEQFMALPQFCDVSDFHCVTTWSQFNMPFEGVAFFTLAELVKPKTCATHLFFTGYDDYTTNATLDACMDDDVMIAHSWGGKPLTLEHGSPARMIIPKLYAWKGAKFIREIDFRDYDELGFWEQRGYSNTANPFKEERFS
jgi:DMSO/TMAO reductase YedYZ molybdopterin-dependent catalytic subunit